MNESMEPEVAKLVSANYRNRIAQPNREITTQGNRPTVEELKKILEEKLAAAKKIAGVGLQTKTKIYWSFNFT